MLGVTDADREDRNLPLRRQCSVLQGLAAQVAAVGNHDDRIMVISRRIKRFQRRADRAAEVRLAARRGLRRQLLERAPEIPVVRRERTDDNARPPERHQRTPIAFQRIDEVRDVRLRTLKPVRTDVLCEHRPRDVDRHHDVAGALDGLLRRLAPLWTRRGEQGQHQTCDDQPHLQSRRFRLRHIERDLRERFLAPRPQERPPQSDNRNDRRQNQEDRINKFH